MLSAIDTVVEIKILRNQLLLQCLSVHNQALKKNMVAMYRLVEVNNTKIKNIKQINDLEAVQRGEYSLTREHKISTLTNLVNDAEAQLDDIYEEIKGLKEKWCDLLDQINDLEKKIPDNVTIFNYSNLEDTQS